MSNLITRNSQSNYLSLLAQDAFAASADVAVPAGTSVLVTCPTVISSAGQIQTLDGMTFIAIQRGVYNIQGTFLVNRVASTDFSFVSFINKSGSGLRYGEISTRVIDAGALADSPYKGYTVSVTLALDVRDTFSLALANTGDQPFTVRSTATDATNYSKIVVQRVV
jgi:hypothetical protein